jgi:predicted AlkP superfamily phosphohydrolase/phosphomutase
MFWEQEEWDYFQIVITGTDRLHHYLWHALVDENHELHARSIKYYQAVDAFVGEMAERYVQATRDESLAGFFMLSDHGFCGIEQEVALNKFLTDQGLLKFETDRPEDIAQISPAAKAFVLDPNRVYVHLKGKYPQGGVDPADAPKVLDDVQAALSELERGGRKLVRRFFRREEAYHGPHAANGPDLVAVSINGFDFKGAVDRAELFGRFGLSGMHTQHDAFLWTTKPAADVPQITQVAGLILEHLS